MRNTRALIEETSGAILIYLVVPDASQRTAGGSYAVDFVVYGTQEQRLNALEVIRDVVRSSSVRSFEVIQNHDVGIFYAEVWDERIECGTMMLKIQMNSTYV